MQTAFSTARMRHGAIIVTSNRTFKEWPKIFNHDSILLPPFWADCCITPTP